MTVRDDPSRFPAAIGLAVVLLAGLAVWLAYHPAILGLDALNLSIDDVQALVESWGMWGVVGSLMLMVLHSFVPVPAEVLACYDRYLHERDACPGAQDCDFVLVNCAHAPFGHPMTTDAVRKWLAASSRSEDPCRCSRRTAR